MMPSQGRAMAQAIALPHLARNLRATAVFGTDLRGVVALCNHSQVLEGELLCCVRDTAI